MPPEDVQQVISKLDTERKKIAQGLNDLEPKEKKQGEQEEKTAKLERQMEDTLNVDEVHELENELEVETEEGQENLEELQQILGLEDDAIKSIAQITSRIHSEEKQSGSGINEIDGMLETLKKQAQQGNIDEELAARCLAEIVEVMKLLTEEAEEEYEIVMEANQLGDELKETHQDLISEKQNEVRLRRELQEAEKLAEENGVQELGQFVESEAPRLKQELGELSQEFSEMEDEEGSFSEQMRQLADESQLTEEQLDKIMAEEQTWSGIIKQSISEGAISSRKFASALEGISTGAGELLGGTGIAAANLGKGAGSLMESLGQVGENLSEAKAEAMNKASEAEKAASEAA